MSSFRTNSLPILALLCIICHGNKILPNSSNRTKLQVPESVKGLFLKDIAGNLSLEFNITSNEEMGISYTQQLYDKFKYTSAIQDVDKKLINMANQIELKLNKTFELLNQSKNFIELYHNHKIVKFFHSAVIPCMKDEDNLEEFEVTTSPFSNPSVSNAYFEHQVNLNQVFKKQRTFNKVLKGTIKQQFFLSTHDVYTENNPQISTCKEVQNLSFLWTSYMKRVLYKPRKIMLLLDHGGSLSRPQFVIVKAVAKQILAVLNESDKIGVLAVSNDVMRPFLFEQCSAGNQDEDNGFRFNSATEYNKQQLKKFVDSLNKGNGSTNHSLGFEQAFQMIKASQLASNETVMILYVSRGLLSSLTEPKAVLEIILNNLDEAINPIVIHTCAVIDESKPVMYETHFLRDIAEQNYTKYNIKFNENVVRGTMLPVNSTDGVGLAVARFFQIFLQTKPLYNVREELSLPYVDPSSGELVVSALTQCGRHGELGVVGMNLYFTNLVEEVAYYCNYLDYTYAFMIHVNGLTVMHPSYSQPLTSFHEQTNRVDIEQLEDHESFKVVRPLLLRDKKGQIKVNRLNASLLYSWRRVSKYYVLCVVVRESEEKPRRPFKVSWFASSSTNELVHHRLDLVPANRMCRHFNQLATLDAGALYLSASCFQPPTSFHHASTLSPLEVQICMAFLKDNTRYLSNPGLREEVRDDVATLAHILKYLQTQHIQGQRGRYIVRRYVTSPSGVLEVFPGGVLSPGFEPTKRTWYLKAMEHRHKTILTSPYLDAGGAGYIVTLAYATEHVVVAMDVTFGYVYKLILDNMPFCNRRQIKCFMMDDRGYLIYHPNLIDPNGHGPIERQHIIHKESLVANDILYHEHFVKKELCNNYADATVQRYYTLNTSIDEVLTNALHGEHSVKYQVSPVQGTNVFIGFVNASAEVGATFCPCSMTNRLCLNCNRMEQKECECPCECPLNLVETCPHKNKSLLDNPICPKLMDQSLITKSSDTLSYFNEELKTCLSIACEKLTTYHSCLGVLGCEWCQMDVDGETLLNAPFCTSIQACFNGILGSPTPYGDAASSVLDGNDLLGTSYSPIGPVIGSVLAACLILIFSFICYRSYATSSSDRFYLTSSQENQVRMSDLNISDEYRDLDNHHDKLLLDSQKHEPISPYCVSTGYRRPPTTVDSDHGYSTMTPHDESEHLSFAPMEFDSLEDGYTSDSASVNTSVSAKRPNKLLNKYKIKLLPEVATVTPNRNCILAPVTVHRNMEYAQ